MQPCVITIKAQYFKPQSGGGLLTCLALAAIVLICDQFTKVLILGYYQLGDSTPVTGFFNVVRAHNTGAAFSFLAHASQKLFAFVLACILGGAVGNVADRVMYGYVVDFLDFYWQTWHFPAFNLADSAITLGAICLILDELLRVRRGR